MLSELERRAVAPHCTPCTSSSTPCTSSSTPRTSSSTPCRTGTAARSVAARQSLVLLVLLIACRRDDYEILLLIMYLRHRWMEAFLSRTSLLSSSFASSFDASSSADERRPEALESNLSAKYEIATHRYTPRLPSEKAPLLLLRSNNRCCNVVQLFMSGVFLDLGGISVRYCGRLLVAICPSRNSFERV